MKLTFTRVLLAHHHPRINVTLRFGNPVNRRPLNAHRQAAFFAPESIFCRIGWHGNAYGTTRWQLVVLQAKAPRQPVQKVAGVIPGAALLLHVEGKQSVQSVLLLIDMIEGQRIDPLAVAATYWRTVQNRVAARAEIPPYGSDRQAAEALRRSMQ